MKTQFEADDIDSISQKVIELLKPLFEDKGPKEIMPHDKHFNVKQLSEYLGMSAQWIYNNMGAIPHFNMNRKPLFRKSEIDTWLEQYRAKSDEDVTAVKPAHANKESAGTVKVRNFKQRRAVTSS